jgi:hypothetical protein
MNIVRDENSVFDEANFNLWLMLNRLGRGESYGIYSLMTLFSYQPEKPDPIEQE